MGSLKPLLMTALVVLVVLYIVNRVPAIKSFVVG